jgi:membrane protein
LSLRSHRLVRAAAVKATAASVRDFFERLVSVRVVESSIVLAAQAFLALFPLVIVVSAVIPRSASNSLLNELHDRFGISGSSESALRTVLVDRNSIQQSLSIISVLLVLGSATAFTRALQRVYQYAWGLPKLGLRGLWRGFAWLLGLVAYLGLISVVAHFVRDGAVVQPVVIVLGFVMWWWTPFILLGGRVRARALLPAAIIITIAMWIASLVSSLVVPRAIRNSETSYGPIGAVFAFESWLVILAGILVVGTVLGATIGLSQTRLGAAVRGTAEPDGWRRQVKPIRIPARRPASDSPAEAAADHAASGVDHPERVDAPSPDALVEPERDSSR